MEQNAVVNTTDQKMEFGVLFPEKFMDSLYTLAVRLAKTQAIPTHYRGKPDDTFAVMLFGAGIGMAPLQSLQNVANIHGKPSIYGSIGQALIRRSGLSKYGIKFEFDEPTMTAKAITHRKDEDEERTYSFSQKDAELAGLWNPSKGGPWKNYPKRMLRWRAFWFLANEVYADVLQGMVGREEQDDIVTVVEGKPKPKKLTDVLTEDAVIDDDDEEIESMVKGKDVEAAKPEPVVETQLCTHEKWMDVVDYFETYPENLKLVKKETVQDLGEIDIRHFDWVWDNINEWAKKASQKKGK